jgi:SNF2 family DNA or RNA helicase
VILHGTFTAGQFVLWAEGLVTPTRRGKAGRHPFALPAKEVLTWAAERASLPNAHPGETVVWLPTEQDTPQPSPEVVAAGRAIPPRVTTPTLQVWQVPCVWLPIEDALSLLLALTERDAIGGDVAFWRVAARVGLGLLAGQQFLPALVQENGALRAFWQVQPEQPEALYALAQHMPPLCRAMVERLDDAPAADALLTDTLNRIVDHLARLSFYGGYSVTHPKTTGSKWLAALTHDVNIVDAPRKDADHALYSVSASLRNAEIAGNRAFRIAFRLDTPTETAPEWRLHYLLQALDDPSLIIPAGQLWRGEAARYLAQRFDNPQERLLAGLGFVGRLFPPIDASLRKATPQFANFDAAHAYTFLREVAPLLQGSGFRVLLPRWWDGKGKTVTAKAKIKSGKANTTKSLLGLDTLVNYDLEVVLAGQEISEEEFLQLAALKQPLVQWRGQWIALDEAQIKTGLDYFERASGQMRVDEALRLGLDDTTAVPVRATGWIKTLLDALRHPEKIEMPPFPSGLRATLRPYQQRGFAWLAFLRRYGLGACLADDMGLGKTLQAITLLLHEREALKVDAPALLVCPTSVLGNWRREVAKFAPGLTIHTHHGAERLSGNEFAKAIQKYDLILTSYPLLARDRELFEAQHWSTVILDEAQNIKNADTKQAQAARALQAGNRVALTGTPVENRLTELWSILHFLNPGYLGGEKAFREQFAIPIERLNDKDAAGRLKRLTAPFILRRVKTDPTIISDLPAKLEMKVYTTLTTEQATLYEAVVQDALAQIEDAEGDGMARRGLVLSMLVRLKQICNHPAQFLKDGSAIEGRSGKLARLTEMLEEIYAVGDRVLIFTQFAEMGELLRVHLRDTFHDEPLWLHGGTPVKQREQQIARFQAEKGPTVFLLSIKAGGVGLNLTRANHVVHFDRWWNPAVENQATDRAFRIGQTRNVQVHKFIASGTLEEKIDAMIESKKALADAIVGADEGWLTELDTAALRDLVTLQRTEIEG